MSIYDTMATSHPKLTRGTIWCTVCGRSKTTNSASNLKKGWPKCCGYTMTIDSPAERKALTNTK